MKTPSCLKSPDFQSLKSPRSIVSVVTICQQSSVWSVNRTLMYNRPSSKVCSTQSTTFPRRPGYLRPGSKVSRIGGIGVRFLTIETLVSRHLFGHPAFDFPSLESACADLCCDRFFFLRRVRRQVGLRRTYPNSGG